jgi:predicted metal-dependent hydrolase
MIEKNGEAPHAKTTALAQWNVLLQDEIALLTAPGIRHKELLRQAHALHRNGIIDSDDLSDLLEQADGALAYAVEALIDRQSGE